MTGHLTPDAVEVLKHLERCLSYLSSRAESVESAGLADDSPLLHRMIEAVRACEQAVRGNFAPPAILPNPANFVCAHCGAAEIECLDWVRVNDDHFIGGNEVLSPDDYWCPDCETHDEPVQAEDYCADRGHRGEPCEVCGGP